MVSLLKLDDFTVQIESEAGVSAIVDSVSLEVMRGETLCIVGESGSGKSVMMLSVVRLIEYSAPVILSGQVLFDGVDLVTLTQDEMSKVRGHRIGTIFQEAMEALNPTRTVGAQLVEAYMVTHAERKDRTVKAAARHKALALLEEVGMQDPDVVFAKYPHQLSGGMQQRVMIAIALMGDPELLIADEPTTALDVTIQAEILRLLRRLQKDRNMTCVLITHDMGVASEVADRIAVVYAGQLVESGPLAQMLETPQHPYTKALLECVPRAQKRLVGRMRTIPGSVPAPGQAISGDRFAPRNALATERDLTEPPPVRISANGDHMVRSWEPVTLWTPELVDRLTGHIARESAARERVTPTAEPIIVLKEVNKTYTTDARKSSTRPRANSKYRARPTSGTVAVKDLNLTINKGEFFGVVGETGSGKSTLGKLILDLEYADHGSSITVAGFPLNARRTFAAERELRRTAQMVFQNPQDSLDPRRTIHQAISEPLGSLTKLSRAGRDSRVREMLDAVGLAAGTAEKYPAELSGGQRQRVSLARAIAPRPTVIVADEPTSALDVSVQGQIVNLMLDLQIEFGLTYIFITHNLSLITSVADRVGVMYRGEMVEVGDAARIVADPQNEYTKRLLAANPDPFASVRL